MGSHEKYAGLNGKQKSFVLLEKPLGGYTGVPMFTEASAVCSDTRNHSDKQVYTSLPQEAHRNTFTLPPGSSRGPIS